MTGVTPEKGIPSVMRTREHNPSDSLKNRVGNFFRGTAERVVGRLKKLGVTGLALFTFTGGLAGCSPDVKPAAPEVSTSSTTATPGATGESSSADTPSNTPSGEKSATPTAKQSSKSPTQTAEASPSASPSEKISTRMDHPNAIPAEDFFEKHLANDPQRYATQGYNDTAELLQDTLDFLTAQDAIALHKYPGVDYYERFDEPSGKLPIFKDPRKLDADELSQLLVKRGIAVAVNQKLGSEHGASSASDADVAPLDIRRVEGVLYANFGPAILARKPTEWGTDGVAAQKFDQAITGIVNRTGVVAGIRPHDMEITSATATELKTLSIGDRTFEAKEVSFTLNGEPYTVLAVFGAPKKQFSSLGHPKRYIEGVSKGDRKDFGKLRYQYEDGTFSEVPLDSDGDPTCQVLIAGVIAGGPDKR